MTFTLTTPKGSTISLSADTEIIVALDGVEYQIAIKTLDK